MNPGEPYGPSELQCKLLEALWHLENDQSMPANSKVPFFDPSYNSLQHFKCVLQRFRYKNMDMTCRGQRSTARNGIVFEALIGILGNSRDRGQPPLFRFFVLAFSSHIREMFQRLLTMDRVSEVNWVELVSALTKAIRLTVCHTICCTSCVRPSLTTNFESCCWMWWQPL